MNDLQTFGVEDAIVVDGHLVSCSLSGRAFISLGAELLALEPLLKSVRLVAIRPYIGELSKCAHLKLLDELSLRGNRIGDENTRLLLGSPWIAELKQIDLSQNNLSDVMKTDALAWAGTRCQLRV